MNRFLLYLFLLIAIPVSVSASGISQSNNSNNNDSTKVVIADDTTDSNVAKVEAKATGEMSLHTIQDVKTKTSTDVASAARTTSGNSGTIDTYGYGCLSFDLNITAASGTTPTLQLIVETSNDASNWSELISLARKTTTGVTRFARESIGSKYYRYSWVITGTTPSFTFSVITTLKNFLPERSAIIHKYADINLASAAAVSSTYNVKDCSNVAFILTRAADGGNNAKYKIQGTNDPDFGWTDVSADITQGPGTTTSQNFPSVAYRFFRLIVVTATNAGTRTLDVQIGAN